MNFLVTGGSRGLGRQLVLDLVASGHNVAFTYRSDTKAASTVRMETKDLASEQEVRAFCLDRCDAAAVDRVTAEIIDVMDTVEVLVNNAAINRNGLVINLEDES